MKKLNAKRKKELKSSAFSTSSVAEYSVSHYTDLISSELKDRVPGVQDLNDRAIIKVTLVIDHYLAKIARGNVSLTEPRHKYSYPLPEKI